MTEVCGEPQDPSRKPFKEGNTAADGSYIVGRGKTPAGTRFQKGDGRPRGRRPKGTRNVDTYLLAESMAQITVNERGAAVTMTKLQAAIKKLYEAGFSGNVGALREVLDRTQSAQGRRDEREQRGERALPEDDRRIIEDYLLGILAQSEYVRDEAPPEAERNGGKADENGDG